MKGFAWVLGVAVLLGIGVFLLNKSGLLRRRPYLRNFETPLPGTPGFIQPEAIVDGLAVYLVGVGEPVLLMPYPHAHTTEPVSQGPLARILVSLGRSVVSFDVPGTYRSTREPVGDMAEMLDAALETLDALGIDDPVDVAGHSMGSLAALAFAIEHPARVKKLVLVGSMSGFPAALKHGMPKSAWKVSDPAYWRFIALGLKVKSGFGTLADHKTLCNTMSLESLHDPGFYTPLRIDSGDGDRGVPIREILWGRNMFRRLNYAARLAVVRSPTLILAGGDDPVTPLPCSEELHRGIPDSRLVVFEASGHSPFLEEPDAFRSVLERFLSEEYQPASLKH